MEEEILKNVETVGAFILDKQQFIFSIGPNKSNEYLGITRLGGHIENGETILEALEREIFEEASTDIEVLSSTKCFFKRSWESVELEEVHISVNGVVPALVVGNEKRATVLFWGRISNVPCPSNETQGIIYLPLSVIKDSRIIDCSSDLIQPSTFRVITQNKMNYDLKAKASVHVLALNQMLSNQSIIDFIEGID